jgi:hypothetical protein
MSVKQGKDDLNLRSDEVQEVLGSVPPWILRYGIAFLGVTFFILLLCCYFIKYPEVISTEVAITTMSPPIRVRAHQSGRIHYLLGQGRQIVSKGQVIGVMEDPASYEDVRTLKLLMEKYRSGVCRIDTVRQMLSSHSFTLGSIQLRHIQLLKALSYDRNLETPEGQLAIVELWASLVDWEDRYLLTAPINGIIDLEDYSREKVIEAGDIAFSVSPKDQGREYARAVLPVENSGKVKLGQRAILRLQSYPEEEFGTLEGYVRRISVSSKGDQYIVEIALPRGLVTTYGRRLSPERILVGTADIVTEELRLIERLLFPLRKLIKSS